MCFRCIPVNLQKNITIVCSEISKTKWIRCFIEVAMSCFGTALFVQPSYHADVRSDRYTVLLLP